MSRHITLLLLLPFSLLAAWKPLPRTDNVILLIPDGCSQNLVTLSRLMADHPLALDTIQRGAVITCSSNKAITDSAAAGTAYATGHKTANGTLAVAPSDSQTVTPRSPLATLAEAAKSAGLAVGLITTVSITDATPGAFAAHVVARSEQESVAESLSHQNFDLFFGGGRAYFRDRANDGKRTDGEDLKATLTARGYAWVEDRDALLKTPDDTKVAGLFAAENMTPALDRAPDCAEPSLAEMTQNAIARLSRNEKGFFLLVEGGQVDRAMHANDPAYAIGEFLAFDAAVAVALDFALKNGRTLVIACPDHDTGGMALGSRAHGDYPDVDTLLAPLKRMRATTVALSARLGKTPTDAEIAAQVLAWWGITLSETERAQIRAGIDKKKSIAAAIAEVVNTGHTRLGWNTSGHTGGDVPLWAFGPEAPYGVLDNTRINRIIADALNLDLAAETKRRFAEASTLLPDAKRDSGDKQNPVLRIGAFTIPANRDYALAGGNRTLLDGPAVYLPQTKTWYLPASTPARLAR